MDFFEISVELGTSGLVGYRRTRSAVEELNLGGAPRPIAAQKLGRLNGLSRAEAREELTNNGFRTRGPSPAGNETWTHPDGSRVTIKSDGEIVRNPNAEAVRSRGLGQGRKGWEVDPNTGSIVRPHSVPREKVN
jgi:hypothetical protein